MAYLNIKLVPNEETRKTRPRYAFGGEGHSDRLELDVIDKIQAQMNSGYSIGAVRRCADNAVVLLDVQTDGELIDFGRCGRGRRSADWKPAERLKKQIADPSKSSYRDLLEIARESGYSVERVELGSLVA